MAPIPRTPSSRHGLDAWLTASGIRFSTWDHWFLLLILGDDHGDWAHLRDRLRAKRRGAGFERDDAEAKLSHLADLETRWASLGDRAREHLRRECRDHRLLRRARAKILEQAVGGREKTTPMRETPRVRLRERALRGYWPRFPVSPAKYDEVFRRTSQARDFHSERATFGLARRLDAQVERELRRAVRPAERVAVLRAFLTSMMLAMECADDSCGVLGDLAHDHFPTYFAVPWREARLSADLYYRDFLEFAIWEDYGLLWQKTASFFDAVGAEHVPLVDGLLRGLRAEFSAADLDDQAEEALTLLGELHVAKRSFDVFERLAMEMGSRHWARITAMAEAALRARRRDLAGAIFAAADQPGMHREHLREQCRRLLGTAGTQPIRKRHLEIVRTQTGLGRSAPRPIR